MLSVLVQRQGFSCLCPVYRVCGANRRQYVLVDIGIRAIQGHLIREDLVSGYLMAAQERLSLDKEESLPCVALMA